MSYNVEVGEPEADQGDYQQQPGALAQPARLRHPHPHHALLRGGQG